MKKLLYLFALSTVLLSACDKGELVENTPYEKLKVDDAKYTYIKILNLTPGSPVSNYYIDGTKFSAALSSTGVESTGYAYNGLFPDFGYASLAPGSHALTAKIVPAATVDANLQISNATITPAAGKYYTMFTTGQYSTTNKSLGPLLILEDIKPALDTSKIFMRFVNLCNGNPNVDVVKGDLPTAPKLITNIPYGGASTGWTEIPAPGNGISPVVKFWYLNSATGVALNATALSYTLTKGRAYTVYSRGIFGTTATATIPTYTFYTSFF
ncbi:MAG: DUF4397 domain-containing protein [Acinetobacter sp.]|nr:MAG: DUF4397 domain-containing protein [Acinetobacter sp.]